MDSVKKPAETDRNEQIEWLMVLTPFSRTYLDALDSHELQKLYNERIIDR